MSKKALWFQTLIFLCFIGVFFILNIALPDKDFSENENRKLQALPKFTFEDLFEGKFTPKFEDYVTDQFAFRDSWTALKARCELALGKDENKGIFLCDGERLIVIVATAKPNMPESFCRFVRSLKKSVTANVAFIIDGTPENAAKIVEMAKTNDSNVLEDKILYIPGGLSFLKKVTPDEIAKVKAWVEDILANLK